MNTRKQILIDSYIARPIAFLLNYLTRLVGKILSIDHSLDKPFKRIAVCKFKGLGSIIQSTPMLIALNERFPDAEIIFVSTRGNESFLKKIDIIDTIITINDKGFFQLIKTSFGSIFRLMKNRPDVYIDLEIYSNFSTLIALFSVSKNRIGFYLRDSSYKMGIYTHMMFFNPRVPISNVYLQIARLFGDVRNNIPLYPIDKNIHYESDIIPGNEYIIVNPNASDLRVERRWGAENFTQLINRLLDSYVSIEIILIGSPSEKDYTNTISAAINNSRLKDLSGRTSIDELIALIRNAKLMITNDTGPMHIAFASNVPTVCLFGPCSPDQYGSTKNSTILYKGIYCSPCVHEFKIPPCGGDNSCMKLIQVNDVFEAVKFRMESGLSPSHPSDDSTTYSFEKKIFGLVNRV